MDTFYAELMNLSEEERDFLDRFMSLPNEVQDLMRLFMLGDPEQSEEAEKTMYDMLEQDGHDVTELRANMKIRRDREAAERERQRLEKEQKRLDALNNKKEDRIDEIR